MQSISTSEDTELAHRIATVQAAIGSATDSAGRHSNAVRLIAVSKTQPATAVRAAISAGLQHFGENYVDEALDKIAACKGLPVTWHYIGAIQSNKTRDLAAAFHWIHTIAREKIARRLNEQCPDGKVLNICLQVNVDGDSNKAGVAPADAAQLLATVRQLPHLRLRGLMTILHPATDPAAGYARLAALFESLANSAPDSWDTLSMGMSGDYREAIAAGATQVRVGTAIFGPRQSTSKNPQQQQQQQ